MIPNNDRMSNAPGLRSIERASTRSILLGLCGVAALAGFRPAPVRAQGPSALTRLENFDGVERIEVGRAEVFYSASPSDPEAVAADVRSLAARFEDAADFFAARLGGDFRYTLALLSPRHWNRLRGGVHALPWSDQSDRLVVVPVRTDMSLLLQSGQDTARARRVVDIISYHQLGHVVTAAFFHPAGFRGQTPVRWFDEVLASYLAHWYMEENQPELADFVEDLAMDVTRRTEPRFSSLAQYDAYHDGYLTSPQGANTLGWYQNAFNLRAAELYDRYGPAFIAGARKELPWVRLEVWTTDLVLEELTEFAPGFHAWADEMAERTRRRY